MSGMLRTKRCFYEVLSIPKTSSEDEIKHAYREAVLLWHPDKNMDRAAEATIRFKEIQNAYETLSDPEKREWYDEPEEEVNLSQFMQPECFGGFEEEERSFFSVYAAVFAQLVVEEREASERRQAMNEQLPGDGEQRVFAPFGRADDCWEHVQRFYGDWQMFSSRKSYFWADKYDVRDYAEKASRDAANRENQKLREAERRKATKSVRDLVQFVKRIDPRVPEGEQELGYIELEAVTHEVEEEERFAAVADTWMIGIGVDPKPANKYTGALCDEGYDTVLAIAGLSPSEFKGMGIKNKGHVGLILSEAFAVKEATADEPKDIVEEEQAAEAEEQVDDDEFFSRGAVAKKEKKEKVKKEKKKPIKRQTASGRFSGGGRR